MPFQTQNSGERQPRELIIVADDDSAMREDVCRPLHGRYRVHVVSNGMHALYATRKLNPDLVLTDVILPKLDGLAVLKALRSEPATRSKPVILFSDRADEESLVEGLEAGADDYLVKPFTARELLARVGAHLRSARVRSDAAEIERRLRAQADLERNRLRESFAQAPAAMALLSGPDHRFAFVNSAYLKMSGRSADQLIGHSVREVFPELCDQPYFALLDNVYLTNTPFLANESPVKVNRNGRVETFYVDFTFHPLRDLEGKVEGILFQGVDVSEEVLARAELEERVRERTAELAQAKENLRTLNRRLFETQDAERRRLARELHDSAGQWLAALKWKLALLREDVGGKCSDPAARLSESMHMVDELSKELRTLSHLMHPLSLDEAGLSPALRSYVAGIAERSGLAVDLEIDPDLDRVPREVETAAFRIIQESLTNVHRHAHTKTAWVRLARDSVNLYVEIQDRGQGIAEFTSVDATTAGMGVGLRGMRERVQQLDGNFEFRSGRDGTTVKATLPIGMRAA
jgi:PAS domain S-box-containing protein